MEKVENRSNKSCVRNLQGPSRAEFSRG